MMQSANSPIAATPRQSAKGNPWLIPQMSFILHDLWVAKPYIESNTRTMQIDMFAEKIAQAYTYDSYRQLIDEVLAQGRTTGPKQSEELTHYTGLNVKRMMRLDKTAQLTPEIMAALAQLKRDFIWLVITEGWCGDAAQIVPVLAKIAEATPHIDLRLVLRDEHPELMDQYLTDGARSIPKVIAIDAATLSEVGTWGPRPAEAQEILLAYKALPEPKPSYMEFATQLHGWYAKNKTQSTQAELVGLLQQMAG